MMVAHESGSYRIPDPMMDRLHEANRRFSEARRQLEAELASPDRTENRIDAAHGRVRDIEHELEQISNEISGFLHG